MPPRDDRNRHFALGLFKARYTKAEIARQMNLTDARVWQLLKGDSWLVKQNKAARVARRKGKKVRAYSCSGCGSLKHTLLRCAKAGKTG